MGNFYIFQNNSLHILTFYYDLLLTSSITSVHFIFILHFFIRCHLNPSSSHITYHFGYKTQISLKDHPSNFAKIVENVDPFILFLIHRFGEFVYNRV